MKRESTRQGESTLSRLARERTEDRAAGRPERGLLTGRGRARQPASAGQPVNREVLDDLDEDDLDDLEDLDDGFDDDGRPLAASKTSSARGRPRTGAKRTILAAIRNIPSYLRLLIGLMGDGRVSRIDRFFVLAAAAYIASPLDFVPDLIPFLGQTDDVFLLVLAVQRLLDNTGRRVLLDHWKGDPDELSDLNIEGLATAASFFLPGRIKRRLRKFARR